MKFKNKLIKFIKKNRKILLVILLGLLIIFGIIFMIRSHMTKLEKDLLEKTSNTTMLYMDTIENTKGEGLDQYILYALEYGYNEEGKEELSSKEIKEIIEKVFIKKVSWKKINSIGITPLLLDNSVMHDPEATVYRINREGITQAQIAEVPIVTYNIKKIKKRGSKYIVKYQKNIVKNPYEILNYYSEPKIYMEKDKKKKDNKKEKKVKIKKYDSSKISDYLTCKGKIRDIKLAVNDDIIKNSGKVDKKLIKVIYKLEGTEFLVESIKK